MRDTSQESCIYLQFIRAMASCLPGMTFKAVSKEATKLVMAFSKPPEPKPLVGALCMEFYVLL